MSTAELSATAWAKVNYTLDVLSLRPDGYHNLASVMQTISLGDMLTVSKRPGDGILLVCESTEVPCDATNLVWRAADAALRASGATASLEIRLTKRIPVKAGLGGGSSDAACALRLVNALLELGLDEARLADLAAQLGSDVPFFLTGGTASVRGRGESVTPLPDSPPLWLVIVKPDVDIATAGAYRALDAIPNRSSARATRHMEELLRTGDAERIVARMTNDFEEAILPDHLPIALLMDDLLMARARNARLCGSGSAAFGVAYEEAEAHEIARIMRLKYASVHVCRALGRQESLVLGGGAA